MHNQTDTHHYDEESHQWLETSPAPVQTPAPAVKPTKSAKPVGAAEE